MGTNQTTLQPDVTGIKDWEEDCIQPNGEVTPAVHYLATASLLIGMPSLTAINWQEFYTRISFYERLYGCVGPTPMTPDQVQDHIGLKTNAPHMDLQKFIGKMYKNWHHDANDDIARYDRINKFIRGDISSIQEQNGRQVG